MDLEETVCLKKIDLDLGCGCKFGNTRKLSVTYQAGTISNLTKVGVPDVLK